MAGPGAYCFGDEERKEVMDVLSSGHLSRYGSDKDTGFLLKVYQFEQEFAQLTNTKYAVATSSGTGSLLISLLALGISEGDEVLVPGYTFVASIGAVIYSRATPVLVEIDESLTMDPKDLESKITEKTKAIMVVHMLGNPCKMGEIVTIAKKYKLKIIEDGCQAAGAVYRGRRVGSIGDISAFSLNRYKNLAAGDGGVLVTNDKDLYERAFAIHDQGHKPNRSGKYIGQRSIVGLNFKMNELTGAVALAQVRKLDAMLALMRTKKAKLKELIANEVNSIGFRELNDEEGECGTLLTIIFDTKKQADQVCERLGAQTLIYSGWHVYRNMEQISNHMTPISNWSQPAKYAQPGDLPVTDDLLSRTMNISIGVVDSGLGAGFGINIHSTDAEIESMARIFIDACNNLS